MTTETAQEFFSSWPAPRSPAPTVESEVARIAGTMIRLDRPEAEARDGCIYTRRSHGAWVLTDRTPCNSVAVAAMAETIARQERIWK